MKTLMTGLALLLTACTSTHWSKPDGTLEGFNRDSYDCVREARTSWTAPPIAILFGPSADERGVNKELYRTCLQSRGYQRVDGGTWVGVRD